MTASRSRWRPTSALARSLTVAGAGVVLALTLGRPAVVVLVAPLLVAGAIALLHKPVVEPRVHTSRWVTRSSTRVRGRGPGSRSTTTTTSRW